MARHLIHQSRDLFTVPVFLAPAFSCASSNSLSNTRLFSTSPAIYTQVNRGNRDKNKKRGVSAIRSTGPRQTLSATRLGPLPQPVSDPTELRATFKTNEDHGLYGFFNTNKEAIIPPSEEDSHGRPWSKEELSRKGWDDLHKLYWVCVKELNVVSTRNSERKRLRVGYGQEEGDERIQNLWKTMQRIRQTLVERHYAHFDAQLLMEEKYIYELFPDVGEQFIAEQSSSDESMYEDSRPAVEAPLPASNTNHGNVDTDTALPRQRSNASIRGQQQQLTE